MFSFLFITAITDRVLADSFIKCLFIPPLPFYPHSLHRDPVPHFLSSGLRAEHPGSPVSSPTIAIPLPHVKPSS